MRVSENINNYTLPLLVINDITPRWLARADVIPRKYEFSSAFYRYHHHIAIILHIFFHYYYSLLLFIILLRSVVLDVVQHQRATSAAL